MSPLSASTVSSLGDAYQGGELQVLVGEFSEFDAARSVLQLVAETHGLGGPEGGYTLAFPPPMERAEARRAELLGARRDVQIWVGRRVGRAALARSKEPVELVDLRWRQRRAKRIPDGMAIERRRLWFDASSVMIRKLVENLIIDVYEKNQKQAEIQKNGEYIMLAGLIIAILNQTHWPLQRETKTSLPDIKRLGDRGAHNPRYEATRQDIDQLLPGLRATVDDLLHLAGHK